MRHVCRANLVVRSRSSKLWTSNFISAARLPRVDDKLYFGPRGHSTPAPITCSCTSLVPAANAFAFLVRTGFNLVDAGDSFQTSETNFRSVGNLSTSNNDRLETCPTAPYSHSAPHTASTSEIEIGAVVAVVAGAALVFFGFGLGDDRRLAVFFHFRLIAALFGLAMIFAGAVAIFAADVEQLGRFFLALGSRSRRERTARHSSRRRGN